MQQITPFQDINAIIEKLANGIQKILASNLIGLYLFGSLVYGDFNEGSSDIDLVAIVINPLNKNELEQIKSIHQKIGVEYKKMKRLNLLNLLSMKLNKLRSSINSKLQTTRFLNKYPLLIHLNFNEVTLSRSSKSFIFNSIAFIL